MMGPSVMKKATKVCPYILLTTTHNQRSSKTSLCMPYFISEDCKTSYWSPLIVIWLTEEAALEGQQIEGNFCKMGAV